MSTPKKRRVISLVEKKAIIEAAENDGNQTKLAKQFNMPRSTVIRILNEKETVLEAINDGSQAKRAHIKMGKHEQMEEAIIVWHKQIRSQNVPISGDLIKVSILHISFSSLSMSSRRRHLSLQLSWGFSTLKQAMDGSIDSSTATEYNSRWSKGKVVQSTSGLFTNGNNKFCRIL